MAMPARPTVQAGSPARARRTSSAHTWLRARALVEGCSSSTRSSSSGTGRSGRPAATLAACSASGCGPAHSSRNAASAASKGSGAAEWSSMRKLQASEADGNEAPSSHPRSTWRVPAMYLARPAADPDVPAVYLGCTSDLPGMYLRPRRLRPARRDPSRRPARLPPTARYIRALTCAAPARYIAGTSEVHARYKACGKGPRLRPQSPGIFFRRDFPGNSRRPDISAAGG